MPDYKILKTDSGPMISHSRTSVYDVLLAEEEGDDFYFMKVLQYAGYVHFSR